MKNVRITLYGIPNCDTVKKTRAWFSEQGVDHQFHDFKKQGVPESRLSDWIKAVGWQKLVNRQGTTWRKLEADVQATVKDDQSASALLQNHPSAIKRPVVEWATADQVHISVGFTPDQWQAWMDVPHKG